MLFEADDQSYEISKQPFADVLQNRCSSKFRSISVNIAKLLRTPFFTKHLRWLLLEINMPKFLLVVKALANEYILRKHANIYHVPLLKMN